MEGERAQKEKNRVTGEKRGWELTLDNLGSPITHLFKEQKKSVKGKGAGSGDTPSLHFGGRGRRIRSSKPASAT